MSKDNKKLCELLSGLSINIEDTRLIQSDIEKIYINTDKKTLKLIIAPTEIVDESELHFIEEKLKIQFSKFRDVVIAVKYNIEKIDKDDIILLKYKDNKQGCSLSNSPYTCNAISVPGNFLTFLLLLVHNISCR